MDEFGAITGYVDVAQLTLYAFWIFFFGLVLYIRREDVREGYPLEADVGDRVRRPNFFFFPGPKEYKLPHGEGSAFAPNAKRDTREIKAERMAPWPGAAYRPTGEPMKDSIGPGAYAERSKKPELDIHGRNLLIKVSSNPNFSVPPASRDPRGFDVVGCDGEVAGKVTDLWVERAEKSVVHLEVDVTGRGSVLLPLHFARIDLDRPRVTVKAITAAQFADVPGLSSNDQITHDEEERIRAYYGGGYMYATPDRAEPLV